MESTVWSPDAGDPEKGIASRVMARMLRSSDIGPAGASRRIEEGLPFRLFVELCAKLGQTQVQFASLLRVSASTLYRRRASGRFEPTESDRLWRYLTLYARAVEVLESDVAAAEWLHAPAASLGGLTPLAVSVDGPGAVRALNVLGRIEHGVFG